MARKPETDLSRYDLARGTRGKYFEKARRSFETIIVDKKVAATLGGAEGVTALLEALAKSVGQRRRSAAQLSRSSPTATQSQSPPRRAPTPR